MDGISIIADELGEVRAQIAALKAREAALRRRLIDHRPNGPVRGARFTVRVEERPEYTFDTALLPDSILADPAFCRRHLDAEKLPAAIVQDDWYYRDVFDPRLLSADIRADARYNTVKFATFVTAKAHAAPRQNMK